MIEFWASLKDALASLQSIATMLALVVGAVWAWRRFGLERLYESLLELEIAATAVPLGNAANFLQVEVEVKNIGKSAIVIGDSANAKSAVTILGITQVGWEAAQNAGLVDPKDAALQTQMIRLYDGDFRDIWQVV